MQIIILGMHRSGTSAVTRLINMMGAYIGPEDQFLPAQPDNPKGFWERIDVINLHKSMLEKLGIDWHLISTLDLNSIDTELVDTFTQGAKKIMLGIDSHRPWVLKDPRLCLLLPLWLSLLEVPVCVHVARHPLSTAQSLAKRDGFPLHFGITLWEQYNARALVVSSGLPRFSICYEQLMEQPVETVELLYKRLCDCGVQALRLPSEREIRAFLESELQHHRTSETQDTGWLTPAQSQLWEVLRDSKLENIEHEILENPARRVLLAGYETLLQERNSLHQRDVQLAATQEQLVTAEFDLQKGEMLLKKSAADLKALGRLFETLHYDIQLAFESLTWRLGFAIADAGRKLGLLQRTFMVQDHVAQIARNYQSWLRHQSSHYELNSALNEEDFSEEDYLAQYPDVRLAIERGEFHSGREHFELRGHQEIANGTRIFIPNFISARNSIIQKTIDPEQCMKEIARWPRRPVVSIVMPVYNIDPCWLEAAISSVTQQIYPNWELCIADDGSTRQETLDALRRLRDPRCKIEFMESNQGIAGASNVALALATGEYVAFLDHDDELTRDALYHVVKAINDHDPDFIYSDEDKLSLEGYHLEPHFKPDYSPDLLLSTNYICHFSVYRKTVLDQAGSFREGFEGSQDHDLVLRTLDYTDRVFHIPRVLYHWRMIPGSTAAKFDSKNYAWAAGRRAIEDTLQRRSIIGGVTLGQHPGTYRVKRVIQGQPRISILMPFRDQPDWLRTCLDSILEKTSYPNFELLGISNNSVEPATFALMEHYAAADSRIRFIRHDVPFNYAALNNFAVGQVEGEHLLLLNNDMAVISSDWLEALLEHSQRTEVGAVGAKLYYPDDTIQHGGVIIGIGGIAGHAHRQFQRHNPGYFSRLHQIQNVSAVTAACLMVKKSLYQAMGGMDEKHLAVAFNDVDFCLRLREKGYLNIFTPYCELYHYESKTRGHEDTPQKQHRFAQEVAYMRKRHRAILQNGDPYYNPNLPLDRDDFGML
ncbi:MAG: glycosyltransferase [Candidatus Competibacteraceae bacterium]|nr:glycosyltransferase [Candidatus Competibacteraceae bacterium]